MADGKDFYGLEGYKGDLVKAMETKSNTTSYGVLLEIDAEYLSLLPYIGFQSSQNGQTYPRWIAEGNPMKLLRSEISSFHPIDPMELPILISNYNRISDINADRIRLEEVATKIDLFEKEKRYKKLENEV